MIRISQTARRYGSVLYDLAWEKKSEDAILQDMETLTKLVISNKELNQVFRNPLITSEETQNIVKELAHSLKLNKLTRTFLCILATQKRLAEIKGIYAAYKYELNKIRSEMTATVSSPHKLTNSHLKRLSKILKKKTGHTVEIEEKVVPSLLGGLVVRMGSYMIDASVQTKLNKLKQNLERIA